MRKVLVLVSVLLLLYTSAFAEEDTNPYIAGSTVASGGDCPAGTYIVRGDWDYSGDTDKMCVDSGVSQIDGTNTGGTISTDYGNSGNGVRFTDVDQYVSYTKTIEWGNSTTGITIYLEVYVESSIPATDLSIFETYYDASSNIEIGLTGTGGRVYAERDGGGQTDTLNDASAAVTADAWFTIGLTMMPGRATQDWMVTADAGSNWYGDGVDGILEMANDPTTYLIGNLTFGSVTHGYRIDRVAILSGWQTACPW